MVGILHSFSTGHYTHLMTKSPKISVLMSVYNTDFSLVKRAIDSVLRQDFQDFELIVIDDGSTTGTPCQLLEYVRQNDHKITYLRHANRGQSRSISRGIALSVGEFITMLDADDEYKPDHLRACLQEMTHNDLIASITETVVDTEADYYIPDRQDYSQFIHVDDCILFATLFGRRPVFLSLPFLDDYGADGHFFERAALQYRVSKVALKTYIYYRNQPNSICSTLKRQYLPELV
jgi:glycosyltransferase involved in cell wall biosynthesis